MKFMSLERMLLKSGKKVMPVLKIPLKSKSIETVRTYSRYKRDYTSSCTDVTLLLILCGIISCPKDQSLVEDFI